MTRTVLITGAARGIGLAAARRFLSAGWRVAALDINRETLAEASAALGPEVLALPADVSDPDQAAVAAAHAAFGRLDALVNNAGIADFGPMAATSHATWRAIMATNLDGPFLMTQAAAPLMIAQGAGAIVNITSISGHRASTLRTAYGTSKAALAHLTRQQAAELGEHNVRVNAVAPGPVNTEMARKVHDNAIRAAYHDAIPLNRYGLESEIADAIHFLCSDQASYITGQVLSVDGGFQSTGIGLPALRGAEMEMRDIPFGITDWDEVTPTEHPGETGAATWRTRRFGAIRVRRVEYSPGYLADHWCEKGHILLCLSGELTTELADGRVYVLRPGMSYQVADGAEPHRSSTAQGATLFIVD